MPAIRWKSCSIIIALVIFVSVLMMVLSTPLRVFVRSAIEVAELMSPPSTADEWTAFTHDVLLYYAHRLDDLLKPELVGRAEQYGMKGLIRFRQAVACREKNIEFPSFQDDTWDFEDEYL